ncbi:hypothetical protein D3C72_2408590 [compost metagenome]
MAQKEAENRCGKGYQKRAFQGFDGLEPGPATERWCPAYHPRSVVCPSRILSAPVGMPLMLRAQVSLR